MWVWFNIDHARLPDEVRNRASECAISVVSVWELLLLVQRGRIDSGFEAVETPGKWLARYPFKVLPLDYETVLLSRSLVFEHEDPADRFIAATAFRHTVPLATSDARLLSLPWLTTIPR